MRYRVAISMNVMIWRFPVNLVTLFVFIGWIEMVGCVILFTLGAAGAGDLHGIV